jgi:hypothetical protein
MALHNLLDPKFYESNAYVNEDGTEPVTSSQQMGGTTDANTTMIKTGGGYNIAGKPVSNPIGVLFIILAILFLLKFVKDHLHKDKEGRGHFQEIDVTLWNIALVTLLAIPGITMAKFFTVRFLAPANPLRVMVSAV